MAATELVASDMILGDEASEAFHADPMLSAGNDVVV